MDYRKSSLALLTVLVMFMTASLQAQQGKMRQNAMNRNYNTATVETISGSITEVANVNSWGLHIIVKTANGITGVHLGPDWFIKGKITLAAGDSITATGSKVKMNGETVIIAKTISKGNNTVQLRNDNGVTLWAGSGKGRNR